MVIVTVLVILVLVIIIVGNLRKNANLTFQGRTRETSPKPSADVPRRVLADSSPILKNMADSLPYLLTTKIWAHCMCWNRLVFVCACSGLFLEASMYRFCTKIQKSYKKLCFLLDFAEKIKKTDTFLKFDFLSEPKNDNPHTLWKFGPKKTWEGWKTYIKTSFSLDVFFFNLPRSTRGAFRTLFFGHDYIHYGTIMVR